MESCTVARVVRTFGSKAEVVIDRQEACGSCKSADLCNAFGKRGELKIEVDNLVGARPGQVVEISSQRSMGLKAAALVYFVPALFFVTGIVVGAEVLRWTPVASALLGGLALVGAYSIAWVFDRRARKDETLRLSIGRVVG